MTLDEWKAQVISDLRAAGFTCGDYEGFPLVAFPGMEKAQTLLELKFSVPTERRIYAEGMLFVPFSVLLKQRPD